VAISLPVYKVRRIAPVRFERAATGNPDVAKPDVDDRGFAGAEHGPVVGVTAGDTVTVRLVRERIDKAHSLFAVSKTPTVAEVVGGAQLPAQEKVDLQIKGAQGGEPKTAVIEIHSGSAGGPVVHRLTVWVFTRVTVSLTPHNVAIAGAGGAAAVASAVNVASVMGLVKAIWRPCGIDIKVETTVNDSPTYAAAGSVRWDAEVKNLVATYNKAGTINAYFVNCIVLPGNPGVLGLGFSKAIAPTFGLAGSAILLGDTNVNGANRVADTMWLANDLAHEVGHFFGLDHPEKLQPPNERKDLWSRRLLMHNFNLQAASGDWRDDFGYGKVGNQPRRGCMVTNKNLTQLTTDGESSTVRTTVNGPGGPY
jgi:hypothetical protein